MKRLMAALLVVAARMPALAAEGVASPAKPPSAMLNLERGTRLRLYVADGPAARLVEGRLQHADGDSVTIDTRGGSRRYSRAELRSVAYRSGGRDRVKGGGIGAAITGAAGFMVCLAAYSKELDRTLGPDRGNGQGAGMVCGLAAVVAMAPGFGVGFAIGTTGGEWNGIGSDRFTMARAASPRAGTVGVRVSLGRRRSGSG